MSEYHFDLFYKGYKSLFYTDDEIIQVMNDYLLKDKHYLISTPEFLFLGKIEGDNLFIEFYSGLTKFPEYYNKYFNDQIMYINTVSFFRHGTGKVHTYNISKMISRWEKQTKNTEDIEINLDRLFST